MRDRDGFCSLAPECDGDLGCGESQGDCLTGSKAEEGADLASVSR